METKICKEALDIIEEYNRVLERINLFDILGVRGDDEKVHSSFIASLLDANGVHGAGNAFLEAFIDVLKEELQDFAFKTKTALALTEVSIGGNGRLDILLKSYNKAIIIENKISSKERVNQLKRYEDFGILEYAEDNFKLIYLCLNENDAKRLSDPPERTVYVYYDTHILTWIDKCIIKAIEKRINPYAIKMICDYKVFIERLIGQSMENKILKELERHTTKNDLFNHYFFQNLSVRLESINCELEKGKLGNQNNHLERYFSFYILPKEQQHPKITFQFRENNAKDLVYGIIPEDKNVSYKKDLDENYRNLDKNCRWNNRQLKTGDNQEGWITSDHLDKYRWWGAKEYMMMTNPNSDLYNYLITMTKELLYAAGVK